MPALATTVYLAGFFAEDKSGAIRHSAMSAVFLRDPGMGDTARLMFDVDVRAYSRFGDSIRLDPMGLKIRDGPTALAFQSSVDGKGNRPTIWEIMERDPIQQIRFHSMMQTLGAFPSHLLKHVLSAFDWNTIGTLVDVIQRPLGPPCCDRPKYLGQVLINTGGRVLRTCLSVHRRSVSYDSDHGPRSARSR